MKKVIVTTSWDDGHKLDMRLARLLEKYGLKATFYISPEDREFVADDRLSKQDIKKLHENFEIGAHTMTHPLLPQIETNVAKQEILSSKKWLEELVGHQLSSFCYPAGEYSAEHVKMVENAGFMYARTVRRFSWSEPKKLLEASTTVHAYKHWSDAFLILWFAKLNPAKFYKYLMNWDQLAIALFDYVQKSGGVFHLWGHSWEIDANEDWARLENVFRYIAHKPDVTYMTNKELVRPEIQDSE